MASVFPQVRGDAIRAGVLAEARRGYGIGVCDTSRLSERRDVIDVDVQALVGHLAVLILKRSGDPR